MNAAEFERATSLKGISIIALKGTFKKATAPKEFIFTELEEIPEDLKISLGDICSFGQWKTLLNTPWELPIKAEVGDVHPVRTGELYIYTNEHWVLLTSASR